jgi:hypothetical protein
VVVQPEAESASTGAAAGDGGSALVASSADAGVAPAPDAASSGAGGAAPSTASPEPSESGPALHEAPSLLGPSGELLAQTEERPSVDDALFEHRMGLLFRAIVADDPEIARPFFFPLEAYEKVKAIAEPKRDWNRRLWKLFVRDVHDYHRELGDEPTKAKLERLELRERDVQWVKPHREGNAIGYWRVRRSTLHVATADGKSKRLDLTAMISWRGHWHVVHLHGFK